MRIAYVFYAWLPIRTRAINLAPSGPISNLFMRNISEKDSASTPAFCLFCDGTSG